MSNHRNFLRQQEPGGAFNRGLLRSASNEQAVTALLGEIRQKLVDAFMAGAAGGEGAHEYAMKSLSSWELPDAAPHGVKLEPHDDAAPVTAPIQSAESAEAALRDAVAESLRGNYYCGRVWEAWQVNTMREDDFTPTEEVDECIDQVMDAVRPFLAVPAITAQQKTKTTDLSTRLRNIANEYGKLGSTTLFTIDVLAAADEIERYYGGMLAWKQAAEAKDLTAQQQRVSAIPDGWKPVPIEPTIAILVPFVKHCCENVALVKQAWREAIAAAPTTPAAPQARELTDAHIQEMAVQETSKTAVGDNFWPRRDVMFARAIVRYLTAPHGESDKTAGEA